MCWDVFLCTNVYDFVLFFFFSSHPELGGFNTPDTHINSVTLSGLCTWYVMSAVVTCLNEISNTFLGGGGCCSSLSSCLLLVRRIKSSILHFFDRVCSPQPCSLS